MKRNILLFTVLVLFAFLSTPAAADEFSGWLENFKEEARAEGISASTLRELEEEFEFQPEILPAVDRQPEFTVGFEEYKNWFVNENMIESGVEKYDRLGDTLARIEKEYEIPPEYLLAIWGIESRYGSYDYEYELLPALVTMAYGHPRSADYFRSELLNLLKIHEEINLPPEKMRGSWAGAMGQPQFLPSTYRNYAVDFTGSGWADIWEEEADILASIANYIYRHGWNKNAGCARQLGEEEKVPEGKELITTGDEEKLRFAVTNNFHAIFNYNHSNHYALTVCQLAQTIGNEIQ